MVTFSEVQQYVSKRYNLDAATAAEITKQVLSDYHSQRCITDIAEYLDYLEGLA